MKHKVKVHDVKPIKKGRRQFLKLSGAVLAGSGLLLYGCSNDDDNVMVEPDPDVFDLGAGDLGVLNYAYALEQLEADFYEKVVNDANFNSTFNDEERQILTDLYYHEVIHRDFFKTAITATVNGDESQVLPALEFDYGSVSFGNKAQVLATSKALEDTGVSAYNGAGRLLTSPDLLTLAGKIVSVEARHAAAIRDLIEPGTTAFAGDDVVNPDNGLDIVRTPSQVVGIAGDFIVTPFTWMDQNIG